MYMRTCTHADMYLCMYVCMYVPKHTYTHTHDTLTALWEAEVKVFGNTRGRLCVLLSFGANHPVQP